MNTVSLTSQLWLPFIATVGASLTVLMIQAITRYIKEHRQRIYAISYMVDVAYRLLHTELILQKHTIAPHIEAIKHILAGDRELLEVALDSDEFDILNAGAMSFVQLPSDHQLLVGYDNIKLVQAFDSLLYLNGNETNRVALNNFVAENLKSKKRFVELSHEHQEDILNTYLDYLRSLEHEANRLVAFIIYIFAPMIRTYIGARKFKVFATTGVLETLSHILSLQSKFRDIIPRPEFFEKSKNGGIQGAL